MFAEFVVLRYTAAEQIHYVQHWLLGNREVWCAKMRLSHFLNFYNEYILILQLNKRKMLKDLFLKEFPSPFTLLLKSKHKSRQHPPTPTPTPVTVPRTQRGLKPESPPLCSHCIFLSLRKSKQLHLRPRGGPIPASRAASCIQSL